MTHGHDASTQEDPESVGFRWGRGDFSEADAAELRARLARRSGGAVAAVLALLTERGDSETRAEAASAMETTRSLPPHARLALLTHATCHFETSRLVGAIAASERSGKPVAASELIRTGYMRVVRGASLAAGLGLEWEPCGKEVLPIAGLVVDGASTGLCRFLHEGGDLRVESSAGTGRLRLASPVDGVRFALGCAPGVASLPSFSIGGRRLHVDTVDPAFTEGWIARSAFGDVRVTAAAHGDLPGWITALDSAARIVERVLPATAGMVGVCVRSFIPVVSSDPATACSESDSALPGAIMSTIDGPPVLAESIVHEFRHNLLHQLEQSYPLYGSGSPTEARFYSPWRNDPRPLHGILHALFVFLDVCAIHAGVREHGLGDEIELYDSAVRLAANVRRIEIALEEFRANAVLTPFGCGFCRGIEAACGRFAALISELPSEAIEQARSEVALHRSAWPRQ